jgi:Holliday junction resolvase-like predicted endonuclease
MSDEKVVFQQQANILGKQFEWVVADFLVMSGWQIVDTNSKKHVWEIDIIAIDPHGDEIWIECKAGSENKHPGLERIDTASKAVGKAWALSFAENKKPYWLITNYLPKPGSHSQLLIDLALDKNLFQCVLLLALSGDDLSIKRTRKDKDQKQLFST